MREGSVYRRLVEPELASVARWAAAGESRSAVARRLGVSPSAFCEYIRKGAEGGEYAPLARLFAGEGMEGGGSSAFSAGDAPHIVRGGGPPRASAPAVSGPSAQPEEAITGEEAAGEGAVYPPRPAPSGVTATEPWEELPRAVPGDREAEPSDPAPRGSDTADGRVEEAFLEKCLGSVTAIAKNYKLKRVEYDPVTGKRVREYEELVCARDEVYVPASTTAQMFWLTNRLPERWQYRPRGGPAGDEGGGGIIVIPPADEE